MPQPSFLTSGDSPKRSDTLWFRWVRILSQYQNRAGANPANNPSRLDTIRGLKYKVLKALNWALASVIPTAPTADVTPGNVAGNTFGLEPFEADNPPGDNWEAYWSLTGIGDPTSDPAEWTGPLTLTATSQQATETAENRNTSDWGALRYRSNGTWSPWTKMTNFP